MDYIGYNIKIFSYYWKNASKEITLLSNLSRYWNLVKPILGTNLGNFVKF